MYKPQLPLKNPTFSFPANPLFKNFVEGLTPPPLPPPLPTPLPAEGAVDTIYLKKA